mmetsp:Transcript_136898/g.193627  ORF Transcript_136898/g.193627 Transcript_136898/m.193627 type:complete len:164 (+) Transcript_136898:69-560(+)
MLSSARRLGLKSRISPAFFRSRRVASRLSHVSFQPPIAQVVLLDRRQLLLRSMASDSGVGTVEGTIHKKLTDALAPAHLEVTNESSMHNVPKGSETHFKVVVVADTFEGMPLIKRHRLVNTLLKQELAADVHALSIQAKTQSQWEQSDHAIEPSPKCMGGAGK